MAIVTGASRGMGRTIAERPAKDGTSVVVSYSRSAGEAWGVVARIEAQGGQAVAIPADVRKVADIRSPFDACIERYGRLDVVVANAGAFSAEPLVEVSEQEFDDIFDVTAKGTFFMLQEAAKRIAHGGRIVPGNPGRSRGGGRVRGR